MSKVRYAARLMRPQGTLAVWLTYLLVSSGLDEKPAEIDMGTSCKTLENPANGEYRCRTTDGGELCKLMCNDGFTLPINEYKRDGQHMALELRGVYVCALTPGGRMWQPRIFFDCIPKVSPAYFVYYYSVTIKPHPLPCLNDSDREKHLSSFQVNTNRGITKSACESQRGLKCYWTYDMKCLSGEWLLDAWLRIPFSIEMLDEFEAWYSTFEKMSMEESRELFTIEGQQEKSAINRKGFYVECPVATRIERDYTCRGCSRGYYMSQSLLECLPCPAHRYQDQDYAHTCKPCPAGGDKMTTGLSKLIDCFHFSHWEEHTSLGRITVGLGCLVMFSAVMLFYRSQVQNEPDGRHREVYLEPHIEAVGGGRLQRLMRLLYPMSMYPSQFDNMSVAAQLPSETTRVVTRHGRSKIVSNVARKLSSPSTGSSESTDSSES